MILKADNLSKKFVTRKRIGLLKFTSSRSKALDGFSLCISKPMIYGLVGPNGAGKTTFIKHCLGLVEPTSGEIEIMGFKPQDGNKSFLRNIGFVSGQKSSLQQGVGAWDALFTNGLLYDIQPEILRERINNLISVFNLKEHIYTQVRQLSLGQRMKFNLISSILHNPKFLFLDEPTIGLDFEAQRVLRQILSDIHKNEGITIILTSHYMTDISKLCSKVAVIQKGRKTFDGTLSELTNGVFENEYLCELVKEIKEVK